VKNRSSGALSAYSLAGGISIPSLPELAIGASFNWYTQSLLSEDAWQVEQRLYSGANLALRGTQTETFDDFQGYNFTLGLLWDAYKKAERMLTLGFVLHTPFTAKLNHHVTWPKPSSTLGLDRWRMDFPLALGAGANYRLSDSFSVAFDADWKQWSEFKQIDLDTGKESVPIGNGQGAIADTLAARLGFERLLFSEPFEQSVYALRGGVFYEPRPALDEVMPVYGFSLGLGCTVKEKFSLDFAYQYRWGDEIEGRNLGGGSYVEVIDYRIQEQLFIGSVIVYF